MRDAVKEEWLKKIEKANSVFEQNTIIAKLLLELLEITDNKATYG